MRFIGSTVIEFNTSMPRLDDVVAILREQLELAAKDHESVIQLASNTEGARLTIRMELEALGAGYLDEIAEAVIDAALAATQEILDTSSEGMTILGSSLLPA